MYTVIIISSIYHYADRVLGRPCVPMSVWCSLVEELPGSQRCQISLTSAHAHALDPVYMTLGYSDFLVLYDGYGLGDRAEPLCTPTVCDCTVLYCQAPQSDLNCQ